MSGRHQPLNGADSDTQQPPQNPEAAEVPAGVSPVGMAPQTVADTVKRPLTDSPRSGESDTPRTCIACDHQLMDGDMEGQCPVHGDLSLRATTAFRRSFAEPFTEAEAAQPVPPVAKPLDVERLRRIFHEEYDAERIGCAHGMTPIECQQRVDELLAIDTRLAAEHTP